MCGVWYQNYLPNSKIFNERKLDTVMIDVGSFLKRLHKLTSFPTFQVTKEILFQNFKTKFVFLFCMLFYGFMALNELPLKCKYNTVSVVTF